MALSAMELQQIGSQQGVFHVDFPKLKMLILRLKLFIKMIKSRFEAQET